MNKTNVEGCNNKWNPITGCTMDKRISLNTETSQHTIIATETFQPEKFQPTTVAYIIEVIEIILGLILTIGDAICVVIYTIATDTYDIYFTFITGFLIFFGLVFLSTLFIYGVSYLCEHLCERLGKKKSIHSHVEILFFPQHILLNREKVLTSQNVLVHQFCQIPYCSITDVIYDKDAQELTFFGEVHKTCHEYLKDGTIDPIPNTEVIIPDGEVTLCLLGEYEETESIVKEIEGHLKELVEFHIHVE